MFLHVTLFNVPGANWEASSAFVSLLPLTFLSGLKIRVVIAALVV